MKPLHLLILSAAAMASTLPLAGCGPKRAHPGQAPSDLPKAQVSTSIVTNRSRTMTEEVAATVRAKLRATLEAKLNGRIAEMPVNLGDTVRKGQLIAKLDVAEIGARLQQAEAALEQAERDWKRLSGLFQERGITQSEYDAAQARLRMAQGTAAEAKAMMSYVEIAAPFDAVVTRKFADVGDLAAPGKPLVEIEDPTALQLVADIPEAIAGNIERGASLQIRFDDQSEGLAGTVSEMAPAADPASRTFRVKLDLAQPGKLKSGQFARLLVPVGKWSSVRVPVSALLQRGQLEIVFVAEDRRARMRLVKSGKRVGDEVEILSGLSSGDTVIVTGTEQLTDGQPIDAK